MPDIDEPKYTEAFNALKKAIISGDLDNVKRQKTVMMKVTSGIAVSSGGFFPFTATISKSSQPTIGQFPESVQKSIAELIISAQNSPPLWEGARARIPTDTAFYDYLVEVMDLLLTLNPDHDMLAQSLKSIDKASPYFLKRLRVDALNKSPSTRNSDYSVFTSSYLKVAYHYLQYLVVENDPNSGGRKKSIDDVKALFQFCKKYYKELTDKDGPRNKILNFFRSYEYFQRTLDAFKKTCRAANNIHFARLQPSNIDLDIQKINDEFTTFSLALTAIHKNVQDILCVVMDALRNPVNIDAAVFAAAQVVNPNFQQKKQVLLQKELATLNALQTNFLEYVSPQLSNEQPIQPILNNFKRYYKGSLLLSRELKSYVSDLTVTNVSAVLAALKPYAEKVKTLPPEQKYAFTQLRYIMFNSYADKNIYLQISSLYSAFLFLRFLESSLVNVDDTNTGKVLSYIWYFNFKMRFFRYHLYPELTQKLDRFERNFGGGDSNLRKNLYEKFKQIEARCVFLRKTMSELLGLNPFPLIYAAKAYFANDTSFPQLFAREFSGEELERIERIVLDFDSLIDTTFEEAEKSLKHLQLTWEVEFAKRNIEKIMKNVTELNVLFSKQSDFSNPALTWLDFENRSKGLISQHNALQKVYQNKVLGLLECENEVSKFLTQCKDFGTSLAKEYLNDYFLYLRSQMNVIVQKYDDRVLSGHFQKQSSSGIQALKKFLNQSEAVSSLPVLIQVNYLIDQYKLLTVFQKTQTELRRDIGRILSNFIMILRHSEQVDLPSAHAMLEAMSADYPQGNLKNDFRKLVTQHHVTLRRVFALAVSSILSKFNQDVLAVRGAGHYQLSSNVLLDTLILPSDLPFIDNIFRTCSAALFTFEDNVRKLLEKIEKTALKEQSRAEKIANANKKNALYRAVKSLVPHLEDARIKLLKSKSESISHLPEISVLIACLNKILIKEKHVKYQSLPKTSFRRGDISALALETLREYSKSLEIALQALDARIHRVMHNKTLVKSAKNTLKECEALGIAGINESAALSRYIASFSHEVRTTIKPYEQDNYFLNASHSTPVDFMATYFIQDILPPPQRVPEEVVNIVVNYTQIDGQKLSVLERAAALAVEAKRAAIEKERAAELARSEQVYAEKALEQVRAAIDPLSQAYQLKLSPDAGFFKRLLDTVSCFLPKATLDAACKGGDAFAIQLTDLLKTNPKKLEELTVCIAAFKKVIKEQKCLDNLTIKLMRELQNTLMKHPQAHTRQKAGIKKLMTKYNLQMSATGINLQSRYRPMSEKAFKALDTEVRGEIQKFMRLMNVSKRIAKEQIAREWIEFSSQSMSSASDALVTLRNASADPVFMQENQRQVVNLVSALNRVLSPSAQIEPNLELLPEALDDSMIASAAAPDLALVQSIKEDHQRIVMSFEAHIKAKAEEAQARATQKALEDKLAAEKENAAAALVAKQVEEAALAAEKAEKTENTRETVPASMSGRGVVVTEEQEIAAALIDVGQVVSASAVEGALDFVQPEYAAVVSELDKAEEVNLSERQPKLPPKTWSSWLFSSKASRKAKTQGVSKAPESVNPAEDYISFDVPVDASATVSAKVPGVAHTQKVVDTFQSAAALPDIPQGPVAARVTEDDYIELPDAAASEKGSADSDIETLPLSLSDPHQQRYAHVSPAEERKKSVVRKQRKERHPRSPVASRTSVDEMPLESLRQVSRSTFPDDDAASISSGVMSADDHCSVSSSSNNAAKVRITSFSRPAMRYKLTFTQHFEDINTFFFTPIADYLPPKTISYSHSCALKSFKEWMANQKVLLSEKKDKALRAFNPAAAVQRGGSFDTHRQNYYDTSRDFLVALRSKSVDLKNKIKKETSYWDSFLIWTRKLSRRFSVWYHSSSKFLYQDKSSLTTDAQGNSVDYRHPLELATALCQVQQSSTLSNGFLNDSYAKIVRGVVGKATRQYNDRELRRYRKEDSKSFIEYSLSDLTPIKQSSSWFSRLFQPSKPAPTQDAAISTASYIIG